MSEKPIVNIYNLEYKLQKNGEKFAANPNEDRQFFAMDREQDSLDYWDGE